MIYTQRAHSGHYVASTSIRCLFDLPAGTLPIDVCCTAPGIIRVSLTQFSSLILRELKFAKGRNSVANNVVFFKFKLVPRSNVSQKLKFFDDSLKF